MTFRLATPDELARMSWHARQRYHTRHRAYLAALEAERPTTPAPTAEPPTIETAALVRAIAELLEPVLRAEWVAADGRARQAKSRRPPAPRTAAQIAHRNDLTRRQVARAAERRHEALALLGTGAPATAVAWAIGVTPSTVHRWRKAAERERAAA